MKSEDSTGSNVFFFLDLVIGGEGGRESCDYSPLLFPLFRNWTSSS